MRKLCFVDAPPDCRGDGSCGVGGYIERVGSAVGEEIWRQEFRSNRPKGKKKNQLVQGGKAIVSAESEPAFHPKEWRRGGGTEKDIRKPALKGGKIKSPAVERIQE